jgi:hypothetical protein
MRKKKIIIFLYNRLFDQVVQSNFWLFITHTLKEDPNYQFHVISFENEKIPLTSEQQKKLEEWKRLGLSCTHLKWHAGTGAKNKLADIMQGFKAVMKLRLKGYKYIMGFASVSGAMAYLYSRAFGLRLYVHSYEPHSEYAIDNKMWPKDSAQFKVLNRLERKTAERATVLVSATRFMETRLKDEWKVRSAFVKIPSVVDDKKFRFNEKDRITTRARLGIPDSAWVLYYPGKFGDLYYKQETAYMFRWLKEMDDRFHLLIVTPHKKEEVYPLFDAAGVNREQYTLTHSNYEGIHVYASASDMGVIAVPPGPSKKFISNIKVGEYLCAGLPYLITKGISEDYLYAIERNVGVVVDDFDELSIKGAYPEIKAFMEMDPVERRRHCREAGIEYRGFDKLNSRFQRALKILTA